MDERLKPHGDFILVHKHFPTEALAAFYESHNWKRFCQITNFRCMSTAPDDPAHHYFDGAKYERNIWQAWRPMEEMIQRACNPFQMENIDVDDHVGETFYYSAGGGSRGIPPWWGKKGGMVQCDWEASVWDWLLKKDSQWDDQKAAWAQKAMLDGIARIRLDHPGIVFLHYHGTNAWGSDQYNNRNSFDNQRLMMLDGNCPVIYFPSSWTEQEMVNDTGNTIRKTMKWRDDSGRLPSALCVPEVMKWYRNKDGGIIPMPIARLQIQTALDYRWTGDSGVEQSIDGLMLFDTYDTSDYEADASMDYAAMVIEELDARGIRY